MKSKINMLLMLGAILILLTPFTAYAESSVSDRDISLSSDGYYDVKTEKGLLAAADLMSGEESSVNIRLCSDIDLSTYRDCLLCPGVYKGAFNGQGHTITGVSGSQGLFRTVGEDGEISNLNVEYYYIVSGDDSETGALCACNYGTITYCYATGGSLNGKSAIGGLAGINYGTIRDSGSTLNGGVYSSADTLIGGIAGKNEGAITRCYADGIGTLDSRNGEGGIGGIAGWNGGSIADSIYEGNLKAVTHRSEYVGCIAGDNIEGGEIKNSLAMGAFRVTGDSAAASAGIAGHSCGDIKDCFSNADLALNTSGYTGAVVAAAEGGTYSGNKYNTDKTSFTDQQSSPIKKVCWIKKPNKVEVTFEDDASSFTCAGRLFSYYGKTAKATYKGNPGNNKAVIFMLDNRRINPNAFKLPYKDCEISTEIVTISPLDQFNDFTCTRIYTGKPVSIDTVNAGKEYLIEGLDYEVVNYTDCTTYTDLGPDPPTEAGYYDVSIKGTGIYNGEATVTYQIRKVASEYKARPDAVNAIRTGKRIKLAVPGETDDGMIVYKLNGGEYTENIPTEIDFGEYEIFYKIKGDRNHFDSEERMFKSCIYSEGTGFGRLYTKKKDTIVFKWNEIKGADGYDVLFSKCGKKLKKIKTITGSGHTKFIKKGLKKNKPYKLQVRPYVIQDGKKVYFRSTPVLHTFTGSGTKNYTVPKAVKAKNNEITLAPEETARIEAKIVKRNKKKKLMSDEHVPQIRYKSTDASVASVTKDGTVKGKNPGTCVIYAYAVNGVKTNIQITVK